MATFNLQNRHYTVTLDCASKTLEIKNHDGELLKAHQGATKAIKIDRVGNSTEIDLLNDRYRVFYNSLIKEAWKAVEKEQKEQSESFFKETCRETKVSCRGNFILISVLPSICK